MKQIAKQHSLPFFHKTSSQFGGVALEYLLVTTFAAITGIAALGIAGSIIKEKVDEMAKKLNVTVEDVSFNPFTD